MNSILDVKISCFKNYRTADNPVTIPMMQWLKSGKYSGKVQMIRSTDDKKKRDVLKAELPGITPSGIFEYRDQNKLINHSGLLQFDIDAHDNRHVANYNTLKEQITNISNVAYCGLSVSGRGYWGLVPIAYPDKHKAHFRALSEAFKSFGLHIDQAPKNVASLRGYSWDPDGYFNHNAELFEFTKEKPTYNDYKSRVEVPQVNHSDKYAEAALNDEIDTLARTANGNRNNQLFKSTAALAQLVAGGVLGKSEVENALFDTARSIGLPKYEIERTINSGFRAGMKNPRKPAKNSRTKPLAKKDSASKKEYEPNDFKKFSDSLNKISPPEKGSQEHAEATRHMINDADEDELAELCKRDPTVAKMIELFDGQVQDVTNLIYNEPQTL